MIRPLAPGETAAWRRLLRPLAYLSIRHETKYKFDWGWPLGLAVVTVLIFWVLPAKPQLLGDKGLLKGVRELIALLGAFYVAALAAVATFARPTLDMPMEGTPPELAGRPLTRRQYVCYLFGYLALVAFTLFIVLVAAEALAPSIKIVVAKEYLSWVRNILIVPLAFVFWNMMITTMLGVYFLVDKVHIEKPVAVPGEGQPPEKPKKKAA